MFLRPMEAELLDAKEFLACFGEASIRCQNIDIEAILPAFPCQVTDFPCKYLGLSLSPKALRKAHWQPLLDELTRRLAIWRTA
jgi:hypothetical protein